MNWRSLRQVTSAVLLVCALNPERPAAAQTPTVTQIAAAQHILVVWSDGSVTAAGANRSGQLGRPKVAGGFLPAARVDLPGKAVQVAAGEDDASYALLENGTVWAWGLGVANNLGVRLSGARDRHTPGQVPGLAGVTRIAAFGAAAMAIMRDGSVRGWGEMPDQLTGGTRVFPGVATPIVVAGLANVTDIAGGPSGGYALTREGTVYAWGGNLKGELGTGTATDEFRGPGLVPGLSEVVSIATTFRAAAAVTRDGRVWTWGSNEQGGLGHGTQADVREPGQSTPAPMAGITDAVEVKAASFGRHFIVRRRNGTLVGWGNSDWGQLGAGVSGRFQLKPTPIKLADIDVYWLGGNFSFARTKDGAVWFWGEQTAARGLLDTRGNQRVPAKVPPEKLLP
ncbi:MAG: RCC1 domain-containing protein [Gemmatimonadales bacterium]